MAPNNRKHADQFSVALQIARCWGRYALEPKEHVMNDDTEILDDMAVPKEGKVAKYTRGAMQAIGGAVPFAGGVFSAIARA